ncbi:hypothetical protein Cgig2_031660 [Carnegiea gigantea]|uniref:Uncharacterized protein n=1 Tax=Carnegiea gigantea TaxID=171969 RepID=A0A9Q1KRP6_9CARY|nr:hypothetical protein Cgig2_031660 [Carnegiea gigantea]
MRTRTHRRIDMESHSQEYVLGQGDVDQSQPWISLPCSSASIPPEIMDSSSDDLWLLPEMPVQPTVTAEAEVLRDLNRENANHGKQTHSEGVLMGEQQGDQLRRTRSADVHKTSERKDKASILQDAAEYMRTLQLQVEATLHSLFFLQIGTGIGAPYVTGMLGVGCSAQYAPIFQVPSPSLAFAPSMPATPMAAFKGSSEQVHIELIISI